MLSPLFLLQSCVIEHQDCVIINYQERAQKQRKTKRNQRLQITLVSKGKGKKNEAICQTARLHNFFYDVCHRPSIRVSQLPAHRLFSLSADWVLEAVFFFLFAGIITARHDTCPLCFCSLPAYYQVTPHFLWQPSFGSIQVPETRDAVTWHDTLSPWKRDASLLRSWCLSFTSTVALTIEARGLLQPHPTLVLYPSPTWLLPDGR